MLERWLQKTSKLGSVELYYFMFDVVHLEGESCWNV